MSRSVKPFISETLSARDAAHRLRSLGARELRDKSTQRMRVFWAKSARAYLGVTGAGGGRVRIGYYRTCPCGGA